jgi:hypothetical protein
MKERPMNIRRNFHPALAEILENRAVPSHAGVKAAFVQPFSAQFQDARAAQRDFNTFAAAYNHDFRTILYAADSSGNINPSANRAAFDTQVDTDLNTLDTNLTKDVSNLSSASTLDSTIQDDIVGTGANSLQSLLDNLKTPTGVFTASQRQFVVGAHSAIASVDFEIIFAIHSATNTSPTPTPTPTPSPTLPPGLNDLGAINGSFLAFDRAYANDVRTILFAAASDGSVNPSANRAAFDTQVAKDLNTLNTNIANDLSNVSSNSTLLTEIQDVLVGTGSTSLQSRLAAISTPTGMLGFSRIIFSIESSFAIGSAQSQVLRDVIHFQPSNTTTTTMM